MNLLDLAREVGLEPVWESSRNKGSFMCGCPNSECPGGPGEDRFILWPEQPSITGNCIGTYWCRVCESSGDSIQFCMDFLGLDYITSVERVGGKKSAGKAIYVPYHAKFEDLHASSLEWKKRAEYILSIATRAIGVEWIAPGVLAYLEGRGIPFLAVQKYRLGYCSSSIWDDRWRWGLDPAPDGREKLFLPKGIIIPSFDGTGILRMKIRRDEEEARGGRFMKIPGGMNGFSLYGDVKSKIIMVVESELDAIALSWNASHVLAVAAGSNLTTPDILTHFLSSKVPNLWICHDNDEAGLKMLEKWQRLYSHAIARPVPYGKDPGEAVQQGLNLKEWLESFKI